jgi:hypothetical protein
VRGPLSEIFALLFDQTRAQYKEDPARYGITPRKHLVDVAAAPEFQLHQLRLVARVLGMEEVAVYSPFLIAKRDQQARRTSEAAPDPLVGVELCHTDPVALRLGGKFFAETGPRELQYLVARGLSLLRPELALTQRLSPERLEAVLQAALSLSVDRFHFTADPGVLDQERKLLERALTQQARDSLARLTRLYAPQATAADVRRYVEGAELTATRAGAFVAGELDAVKKLVLGEGGGSLRVPPRTKLKDLMIFALGEDLHALRVAVGTDVEIQPRREKG